MRLFQQLVSLFLSRQEGEDGGGRGMLLTCVNGVDERNHEQSGQL